jgi:hypothetical protein
MRNGFARCAWRISAASRSFAAIRSFCEDGTTLRAELTCYLEFTVSTGQGAIATTRSATLPSAIFARPVRP